MHFFADETTGGEPGFYVRIPEMTGCVSDGETIEEAKQNLEDAKVYFIYFLPEDGLSVPEPRLLGTNVSIDMNEYTAKCETSPRLVGVSSAEFHST